MATFNFLKMSASLKCTVTVNFKCEIICIALSQGILNGKVKIEDRIHETEAFIGVCVCVCVCVCGEVGGGRHLLFSMK